MKFNLKKTNTLYAIIFISVIICIIQITKAFINHRFATTEDVSIQSSPKKIISLAFSSKTKTTSDQERQFLNLQKMHHDFFKKIDESLGQDELSFAIKEILAESVKNLVTQPALDVVPHCSRRSNCPFDLAQMYRITFARLQINQNANIKALLQESMIQTDLPLEQKIQFLIEELSSPQISMLQESSYRDESGTPRMSDEILYLLATQNRLFQLTRDYKTTSVASFFAIQHLQDRVGRILLATSLLQSFPEFRFETEFELQKIGFDPTILSQLL